MALPGAVSEACALGFPGRPLDLLKRLVAGHGHEFVWRAAPFGQPRRGRFAPAMSRAMRQSMLIAAIGVDPSKSLTLTHQTGPR